MLRLLYLLLVTILFSCNIIEKHEEPEYAYAYVSIEANPNNKWDIGLMSSGKDINNTFIMNHIDGPNYQKLIYKNKPFAILLGITHFDESIVIKTTIDTVEQEIVIVDEDPNLPLLIIYSGGNEELVRALAKEIEFEVKAIVL